MVWFDDVFIHILSALLAIPQQEEKQAFLYHLLVVYMLLVTLPKINWHKHLK